LGLNSNSNVGRGADAGAEAASASAAAVPAGWLQQRPPAVADQGCHTPVTVGCRTCFYSDPGARQVLSRQVSPVAAAAAGPVGSPGCGGVTALVPETLALQSRTIKCSLCGVRPV
jgi:hypothetical protein